MCGLFGWISYRDGLDDAQLTRARAATRLLAHRGPDDAGEWTDGHTFMGHQRLSIIDLSDAAHQPFLACGGRYVFTYNGEIYNYLEVRRDLEREGYDFRSHSDTEVFLAALLKWGDKALTRVDGMFAAAMHDRQTGDHLLVRDPLGQKPLYYHLTSDGVVYASELRSILALDVARWSIDRAAFRRYLMMGYYAGQETPVTGIRKLLPGCLLRVNRSGASVERYWDSVPGADEIRLSEEEAFVEFDRLFGESCERSMRSDVPYGVFLSGGIDSSLVAAYCRRTNATLSTVSLSMSEADFDETPKAQTVARHLDVAAPHRVCMTPEVARETIGDMLRSMDEPHGDPGYVNMAFLARAARRHMVVALAGDGGDELFAGYQPFTALRLAEAVRGWPSAIGLARTAAQRLPSRDGYIGLQFKALAFLQGFSGGDAARFPLWLSAVPAEELEALCPADDNGTRLFAGIERMLRPAEGRPAGDRLLYYYQKVFLPEFVCMHTDRASMQTSLEVRSPFLSRPLIEFANTLPFNLKYRRLVLKRFLRRVAERRGLPHAVVTQQKQGFTLPAARWLKTSLRAGAEELFVSPEWADGLVNLPVLRRYFEEHMTGQRNHYRVLYHLMMFQAWRRKYPALQPA
jgi:asparagine synthase (glutamine-hydrolysing)